MHANGIRSTRAFAAIFGPLLLATTAVLSTAPAAATAAPCRARNVPQDTHGHSLIRMVERARAGDLLRVRGTCPGEIVIARDLVIRGMDGAALTGRGKTRVVRVTQGATVTLTGLRIVRGDSGASHSRGHSGGGLWVGHATVILDDSVIARNRARWGGGGIRNAGTLTVTDSIIRDNRTSGRQGWEPGGGIWNTNGGILTLARSIVSGNRAGGGGGIANQAALALADSIVSGNMARWGGGGIESELGVLDVTASTLSRNWAREDGGGILSDSMLSLTDATVSANRAGRSGGGIANRFEGLLTLADSTVSGNRARWGAGIANDVGAEVSLTRSTITHNSARTRGGGIWNRPVYSAGATDPPGTVILDATSSVTGNVPDDCVRTSVC